MASKRKKIALGVIAVTAIVAGGLAAWAYFTTTGTGTGEATVGTATPWSVTEVSTTGDPLLPGAGTQTVTYTITNASEGTQQLTSVAMTVEDDGSGNVLNAAEGDAPVDGCLVEWFTVDNSGAPETPDTLAGGASVTGAATIALDESGTNQDPCQGVTPVLVVTAT